MREEVLQSDEPVVALALAGGALHYAAGDAPEVHRAQSPTEALPVGAPARALFTLRGTSGEVLFVGTKGAGVQRCQGRSRQESGNHRQPSGFQ